MPVIVVTTLSASLLVTSSIVLVRWLGLLQGAELTAYDHLSRRRPPLPLDDRFLIVGISETDIQTRQEYPIHDRTLAELLTVLLEQDPLAIGVDIGRDIPQGEGRSQLEAVMAAHDRIISGCLLGDATTPGMAPAPGVPPDRTAFLDLPVDPDGVIRRTILVSVPSPSEQPAPIQHVCNDPDPNNQLISLGFSMALHYLTPQGIEPFPDETGNIQLGQATLRRLGQVAGGYRHSQAIDYQILLNYRGAEEVLHQVSLSDVLERKVDPNWIEGKIVLIGYTSLVAQDVRLTPFSLAARNERLMPGVEIHAQAASQLISAALGERSLLWYWAWPVEVVWILGWAIAAGAIAYVSHRVWLFILLEQGLIIGLYIICFLAFLQGGWLPLIPGIAAILGSAFGVALLSRADEGGYTQAIYEQMRDQVKGMLQPKIEPNIEIDQKKRQQEVSEIVETSYFKDLAARAKAIRDQRKQSVAGDTSKTAKSPSDS